MLMPLKNIVVELNEGKQQAFRDAQGINFECCKGVVWLTIEGQPGDFLLVKGDKIRIESNGLALVQGLPSGEFRLNSEVIYSISKVDRLHWHIILTEWLPRFAWGKT